MLVFVFNKLQVWTLDSALSLSKINGSLPSHVHRIQGYFVHLTFTVSYIFLVQIVYPIPIFTFFVLFCFVLTMRNGSNIYPIRNIEFSK